MMGKNNKGLGRFRSELGRCNKSVWDSVHRVLDRNSMVSGKHPLEWGIGTVSGKDMVLDKCLVLDRYRTGMDKRNTESGM